MTKDQLQKVFEVRMTKKGMHEIADICAIDRMTMHDLIDLSFDKKEEIAFRAAWVLEQAILQNPAGFAEEVPYFLECYEHQSNHSCQRHFTKIVMYLLEKGLIPENFDYAGIIEPTFAWLADDIIPVAVKANCMSILFTLVKREDWIAEELQSQIEFLMKNGTAAIQSRGKKILQKLAAK